MNRAERRAAAKGGAKGPRRLCAPGTHEFRKITTTVAGETTATYVICKACGRTFQQVMEQSPEDLAIYRAWLQQQREAVEHNHESDPDGLPVDDCPGCARAAALDHAAPEELR